MKKEDLKLKLPLYSNKVELFIKGDVNDGDYISETNIIDLDRFEKIAPVLKKLSEHGSVMEVNDNSTVTQREIDMVIYYFPSLENYEVHTIEEISCWFLCEETSIRYEIEL